MSPPVLVTVEEGQSNVSTVASASSQSLDCFSQNVAGLNKHNYIGLSDCLPVDSSLWVQIFTRGKEGGHLSCRHSWGTNGPRLHLLCKGEQPIMSRISGLWSSRQKSLAMFMQTSATTSKSQKNKTQFRIFHDFPTLEV